MKSNLILSSMMVAGTLIAVSCGTDDELTIDQLPTEVASDFDTRHPSASNISWEKEGNYYEAEWTENGLEKEIVYDLDGNWIQTESEISLDQIPQAAIDYINANYVDAVVEEAESIMRAEGDFVEVEILDGDTERELLFDDAGNFIEEVIEADDDDDDDDD